MILADYHLHTSFSSDSESPMEDMIKKAISLGLKTICFIPITLMILIFFWIFRLIKKIYLQ